VLGLRGLQAEQFIEGSLVPGNLANELNVNLPETKKSRFGEQLNAEKMKKAVWLKPETVAQIEFLEWTETDHLRHSTFVDLRDDKHEDEATSLNVQSKAIPQ
jgi:ATP-dependent DNA ligase